MINVVCDMINITFSLPDKMQPLFILACEMKLTLNCSVKCGDALLDKKSLIRTIDNLSPILKRESVLKPSF